MSPGHRLSAAEAGSHSLCLASALTSCFGDRSRRDACFTSFEFIARHKIILSKHSWSFMKLPAIGGSEEMLQTPRKEPRSPGPGFTHKGGPRLTFAGGRRWGHVPGADRGFCSSGHGVPALPGAGLHLRELEDTRAKMKSSILRGTGPCPGSPGNLEEMFGGEMPGWGSADLVCLGRSRPGSQFRVSETRGLARVPEGCNVLLIRGLLVSL